MFFTTMLNSRQWIVWYSQILWQDVRNCRLVDSENPLSRFRPPSRNVKKSQHSQNVNAAGLTQPSSGVTRISSQGGATEGGWARRGGMACVFTKSGRNHKKSTFCVNIINWKTELSSYTTACRKCVLVRGGPNPLSCHQMSDFKAKMYRIQFRLGLCPRPRWGSL